MRLCLSFRYVDIYFSCIICISLKFCICLTWLGLCRRSWWQRGGSRRRWAASRPKKYFLNIFKCWIILNILNYFLIILFLSLLCLSLFSNRVNGVLSRKGTFYSSLLHHNIYYIPEWPKKSTKKAKTAKSIPGTAWKKLNWIINITLIRNIMSTLPSKRYTIGYKVGLGREGGFLGNFFLFSWVTE